jgi:hypothetical protein
VGDPKTGIELIAEERARQVSAEGYDAAHDDEHGDGSLAWASVCYAAPDRVFRRKSYPGGVAFLDPWPWSQHDDRRPYIGNVPGFEWAKDAATKMHEAAGRAEELATKINKIPDTKSVLINIGARVTSSRVKVGGEYVNVGLRARGGPVRAGSPYIVGEQGPELVVPSRSGYVIPAPQTKAALASAAGQSGQAGRSYNFYGNLSGDPDEIAASIEYRARRRDVLERAYV